MTTPADDAPKTPTLRQQLATLRRRLAEAACRKAHTLIAEAPGRALATLELGRRFDWRHRCPHAKAIGAALLARGKRLTDRRQLFLAASKSLKADPSQTHLRREVEIIRRQMPPLTRLARRQHGRALSRKFVLAPRPDSLLALLGAWTAARQPERIVAVCEGAYSDLCRSTPKAMALVKSARTSLAP